MLSEYLLLDRLANEAVARGDLGEEDRLHTVAVDHLRRSAEAVPQNVAELVLSCRVAAWLAANGELNAQLASHVRMALRHVTTAARNGSADLPRLLVFLDWLPVERDWWVRTALSSIAGASLSTVEA